MSSVSNNRARPNVKTSSTPDVFHAPLNEVLELVRMADEQKSSHRYEVALYEMGFDVGYDFGSISSEAVGRQFRSMIAAAEYVNVARAAYGLRGISELLKGLRDGRENYHKQLENPGSLVAC